MFSSTLVARIKEICEFPSVSESERIISGLRWIGLFSSELVKPRAGNLLDTLCAQLESLMKYEQGERDLVMLQHKFVVEWADGTEVWKHMFFRTMMLRLNFGVSCYSKSLHPLLRRMAVQMVILRWR